MFRPRCMQKISANIHRRLKKRVSAIDSTPHCHPHLRLATARLEVGYPPRGAAHCLPRRFAVRQLPAAQEHSPSGVNRPLRGRFNIRRRSAKSSQPLRCGSLCGYTVVRPSGSWNLRYVLCPFVSAKPMRAVCMVLRRCAHSHFRARPAR